METYESIRPKVVVALAVYNGMEWIQAQLDSILNQQSVEVTIFISVDPSWDASESFCLQATVQHQNIVVLPNAGKFGGAAKNFFRLLRDADLSKCDYVSLSDQDDIWLPTKLSRAVSELQSNNADAYSSNVTAFWPNGKQKLIKKGQPQQIYDYVVESPGPGCTFVLKQKLALDIQAFLIEHQELCKDITLHDWFIYAFTRSRGFKWTIDHESHMLYRQHSNNVVGVNVGFKAKLQRFKLLREGWLIRQAILIGDILGYGNKFPIRELKNYSFVDRFTLIINVRKLRRRFRDCLVLAIFFLFPLKK